MEVNINNHLVKVIIKRKKIKNIYFRFDEKLNLVVSASIHISNQEILKLITKNKNSLEKMFLEAQKLNIKNQEFWYLGQKYDLKYDPGIKEIEFQNGVIFAQNETMLNKFLQKQTQDIFIYEVNNLKKIIKTPAFSLKIRKMKTRWGVCNYKLKTITLNSELIRYSKEALRYVIIHEMCHFYHHNHSKDFWHMVSIYYPNYKIARKELNNK